MAGLGTKISDVVINIEGNATSAVAAVAVTEGAMTSLSTVAAATGASLATSMAVATAGLSVLIGAAIGAAAFIGNITAQSEEQNTILQKTASILATTGISYADNADEIDANIESLSNLTGITENEVLMSYNKLLTAQISVSDGFRLNKLAADLAYTADIDLAGASDIVKQAIMGNVDGLGDYGFILDGTASKTEIINDIFAQESNILADSADAADSLTTQNSRLYDSFGDIVERVGNMLTPIIMDSVTALNDWGDAGGWEKVMGGIKGVAVLAVAAYESVNFFSQSLQMAIKISTMFVKDSLVLAELAAGTIDAADATERFTQNSIDLKEGLIKDANDFINPIKLMNDMINETGRSIDATKNKNEELRESLSGDLELPSNIEEFRAAYLQDMGFSVSADGEKIIAADTTEKFNEATFATYAGAASIAARPLDYISSSEHGVTATNIDIQNKILEETKFTNLHQQNYEEEMLASMAKLLMISSSKTRAASVAGAAQGV